MNSEKYWREREEAWLKKNQKTEQEYEKEIERIYKDMLDACQNEINAFYGRYASKEGITLAEAKKRVSQADIKAYERKAKRYVKEKNFSKEANEEMRLYNLMMKVNRLEMLKANIGLELLAGHDELEKFMAEILKGRTSDELERQAGILGDTIKNNEKLSEAIVDSSFHNATFYDRIHMYHGLTKADMSSLLERGLIQGKNARLLAKDLESRFNVRKYDAIRLMRTELARVQTEAQKKSFEKNGFTLFKFICNVHGNTCDDCKRVASTETKYGTGVYLVSKMMYGTNAPPLHPQCRCSTAAYENSEDYEDWIEFLANGGTTEEYKKTASAQKKKKLHDDVFLTLNNSKGDSIRPKSIRKEMEKSEVGKEMMSYLEKEKVSVRLQYGYNNPLGSSGEYDPIEDVISIYCDVTKTTKETASTVIHEAMHRKQGCKGTFNEEVECYKAELLHKKGKLTDSDMTDIINFVKENYPELK